MTRVRFLLCSALTVMLTACSSAPMHYHTLIAPALDAGGVATPSGLSFELLPVSVPAQVDQPQLVVRQGEQGVVVLEGERWIAGLGDEVRGALSADLARDLGASDVSGLPDNGHPVLRIKVDLRRFDSAPGSYALIEAAWSLRMSSGGRQAMACTTRVSQDVSGGYPALVRGHQQALARLASQIAAVAQLYAAGQSAVCPRG